MDKDIITQLAEKILSHYIPRESHDFHREARLIESLLHEAMEKAVLQERHSIIHASYSDIEIQQIKAEAYTRAAGVARRFTRNSMGGEVIAAAIEKLQEDK